MPPPDCAPPVTVASPSLRASRGPVSAGFTLVELLLAVSLLGLVLALAVPSFDAFLQRRRIEGLSSQLTADLQYFRTLTVARNEGLRLAFAVPPAGSGYVIHGGAAGACACVGELVRCNGAVSLRSVCLGGEAGVQMRANVASMLIDPRQGTVTPTGSIEIAGTQGGSLRHVVNIMGRVRHCATRGRFAGVPAC